MVNTPRLVMPGGFLLMLAPAIALAQLQPVVPPSQGVLPPPANPTITDPSQLTAVYQNMIGNWFSAVAPYAYDLFYALAGLELAVFGWNLWMNYHGDIRAALMMTANKILILGFFLSLLMNGQAWMGDIINMFVTIGKQASGIPGLGPSTMLLQGFKIFGTLLWQATKTGLILDFPTAVSLILVSSFGDLLRFPGHHIPVHRDPSADLLSHWHGLSVSRFRWFSLDHQLRRALLRVLRRKRGEVDGALHAGGCRVAANEHVDHQSATEPVLGRERRELLGDNERRDPVCRYRLVRQFASLSAFRGITESVSQ